MANTIISKENLHEQKDELLALQSIYDGGDEERINVLQEPDDTGCGQFSIQVTVPPQTSGENIQVDIRLPVCAQSDGNFIKQENPQPCAQSDGNFIKQENPQPCAQSDGNFIKQDNPQPCGEIEGGKRASPPNIGHVLNLERSVSGHNWTGSFVVKFLSPIMLHLTFPPEYPSSSPPVFEMSCAWLNYAQLSALCKQLDSLWEASPYTPIVFSWMDWLENQALRFLGVSNKLILHSFSGGGWCGNATSDELTNVESGEATADKQETVCSGLGEVVHTMLQYNSHRESVQFCKSLQECSLCFDIKFGSLFFRLHPCGHYFCRDCLTAHCALHVMEGTLHLIKCPHDNCDVAVPAWMLQTVLPPDKYVRWEQLTLQKSLDQMEDVVYCPRCKTIVIREQEQNLNLGYCLVCYFSFCTLCQQPWHQGIACKTDAERLEELEHRVQPGNQAALQRFRELQAQATENAISQSLIKRQTVRCPRCKIPVEKISGCNKMTCQCGQSFCWLCGKAINGYEHFKASCELFPGMPVPQQPRPQVPDAILWMQAQLEVLDGVVLAERRMRCVSCKQTLYKVDNNNHLRCWNCKTHNCFFCRSKIRGVITQHFHGACPQHS